MKEPTHCTHAVLLTVPCPACQVGKGVTPATIYLDAAKALAVARVKEAEAFLRHKIRSQGSLRKEVTDGVARAQAIVETNSELDISLALLEISRGGLGRN